MLVLDLIFFTYLLKNNKMCNLKRNCPDCKKEILYSKKSDLKIANKNKSLCKKCSQKKRFSKSITNFPEKWVLKCSICSKNRTFKSYNSFKNAEYRESQLCNTCNGIINVKNNEEVRKKISNSLKGKFAGEKNPFYGKKHSDETKDKIRNNTNTKGKNNGMYGIRVYDIWVEKFGKIIADEKNEEFKKTQSKNSSGENNPMYGKPSPQGSGNGWSGWYKNWFFRSLRELSYMINEIEYNDSSWESGEQKKYKIPYIDWDGKNRNYFPDFIVDNKYMIECKPLNLQTSASVLCKKQAAEIFCKDIGLKYVLLEPALITTDEIKKLYKLGNIKFLPKYEKKFLDYKEKA
jgi:hypothetical protein